MSLAQGNKKCEFSISGYLVNGENNEPLEGVSVAVKELNIGAISDANGYFEIKNLCSTSYTLVYQYIGYKTLTAIYHVAANTQDKILLHTENCDLPSITIYGVKEKYFTVTQSISAIESKELDRTRGLTLGESLKLIPGVNSIQTGPSISKPVIHGLHSNGILIINNGVRQEGQQWGSEHAPEIDPFVATRLTVVKGAGSIRYGSDAIGGVILVEPKTMPVSPGINGEVNLVGMSNGRMGVASGIVEGGFDKKLRGLAWRIQGTERRAGNFQTANYYMENTGLQENNFSGTLAYNAKNYGGEVYYSRFDTKLGIGTFTHVETISDLKAAIQRTSPITPSYFNYTIDRPYQTIKHDLFKVSAHYRSEKLGQFNLVYARQQNERSEYGFIPYTGSLNPELFLRIETHTLDVNWQHKPIKNILGSLGFNGITQGNVREYEFLIPNFRNYGGGIFAIERWSHNHLTIEAGIRYDYRWLRVYKLDNNTIKVITPTYHFNNVTGSLGAYYELYNHWSINVNASTAWKAPTVNELFSNGVHQSAAAYEIGNPNLTIEQAYNFNASINYTGEKLSFDLGVYNNYIHNYTFLKPDLAYIKTIRGAFPTFTYTQVDATFRGIDVTAKYNFTKALSITSKTALIFAYNHSINDYLVLIPANRFDNSLKYEFGKLGKLKEFYISLSDLYVAQQTRVPANSDYTSPPAGYNLIGVDFGFDIPIGKQALSVNLSVTNLLNVSYRDYLNRFRYYTDDLGRNLSIRLKMPFEILKTKSNNSLNQ